MTSQHLTQLSGGIRFCFFFFHLFNRYLLSEFFCAEQQHMWFLSSPGIEVRRGQTCDQHCSRGSMGCSVWAEITYGVIKEVLHGEAISQLKIQS